MADEGSATPVAAAPAAQPAGTEKKTATVGDSRSDDPPAESVASKDDEPKATPAEEKPAEPESKPDTIMEDVDTAKPTEGKTTFYSAPLFFFFELIATHLLTITTPHRFRRETS